MTKSDLVKQIKAFEGFRQVAYADPGKGVLTIGYGRTQNVRPGETTTREIEDKLLNDAVSSYYNQVVAATKQYNYNFTENQLLALTDFTYNCGRANLLKLLDFGKRSIKEIGDKILLYDKAGGKTLSGLTKRRQFENALYFDYVTNTDTPEIDIKKCTFELQAALNHLIDIYHLPVDKIVTDGIWGNKSENCYNSIVNLLRK